MCLKFEILKSMKLVVLSFSFFSVGAFANTDVYFQNRAANKVTLETEFLGSPLSTSAYKIIKREVAPGALEKVFAMNRDKGIKNGKVYYIKTHIKIGDKKFDLGMSYYQRLEGRTIGSYINHGMIVGSRSQEWSEKNTGKYLGKAIGNTVYRLHVYEEGRGIHDDLFYTFDAGGFTDRTNDDQIKALFYNVYMRPIQLFNNGQHERAQLLAQSLKGRDILAFSEAFDNDVRAILKMGLSAEYPYQTAIVGSDRGFEQDGGVFIASRLPILEEDEYLFGSACARMLEDCLADKGVKYAKLWDGKRIIHVFATHLQNGGDSKDIIARNRQVKLIHQFMLRKVPRKNTQDLVLLMGDYNIDLKRNQDAFSPFGLKTNVSDVRPYSWDPDYNELATPGSAEQVDYIYYSEHNLIPATFELKVIPLKSKRRWKSLDSLHLYKDLSDHFPVEATLTF